MKNILKKALSMESRRHRRTAGEVVIIKGNPDKMLGQEKLAEAYYNEIADYVRELGFTVKFDLGEPMTCPDLEATFWIAHSRGVDRIRCIEPSRQWRFLKFGDLDGVIHPKDAEWQRGIEDHLTTREQPPKEHFLFTEEQKREIDTLVERL